MRGVVQLDGGLDDAATATTLPLPHGKKAVREGKGQAGILQHTVGWRVELEGGRGGGSEHMMYYGLLSVLSSKERRSFCS